MRGSESERVSIMLQSNFYFWNSATLMGKHEHHMNSLSFEMSFHCCFERVLYYMRTPPRNEMRGNEMGG